MALTIDTGAQVFTFINTFHTDESRQAALVASLKRFTEEATASLPGFVGAAVHTSVDGARVVNYVQWCEIACNVVPLRGVFRVED